MECKDDNCIQGTGYKLTQAKEGMQLMPDVVEKS